MTSQELIGKIAALYLNTKLSEEDEDQSTARYLLDCLSPDEIAAIAQTILGDSGLASKIQMKLPKNLLSKYSLPEEILTVERSTYFRNYDCPKDALLIATTGDDEKQSLQDITPIGSAQLMAHPEIWVSFLGNSIGLDDRFQGWWVQALKGLQDVRSFSLERFASYLIATQRGITQEGLTLITALGNALPALRAPKDTVFFNSLNDKTANHRSKWSQLYTRVIKSRSCYLRKQTPSQSLLTEEQLKDSFNKVKDDIPVIHHDAIWEFCEADSGWNVSSERLSLCEWEDINPLFNGLKKEKYNLGQKTIEFYDDRDEGLLNDSERLYLDNLKKRKKLSEPQEDDEEFYENHRQELKDDSSLKTKWDHFVYGYPIESGDFLVGIALCLESLFGQKLPPASKKLTVRSDKRTKNELKSININAGSYFATRYKGLDKIFGSNVIFDFGELLNFNSLLEEWRSKKGKVKLNRSCAKKAIQIKFFLELEIHQDDGREANFSKQLVWKFNPDGVPSEFPRDLSRLIEYPLVISDASREAISGKGSLQSLDLRNSKTLHACFSQDRGSLISVYKAARNIQRIWDENYKEVLELGSLSNDVAITIKELWEAFSDCYSKALNEFYDYGICGPNITEQCKSYSKLLDYICSHAKGDTNRSKLLKPLLQIGASKITGGNPTIIITPWHPLRMFALINKAKQVGLLIKNLLSKEGAFIEDSRLFFRELKNELEHPYYPEVVLGWDENKPEILSCTDYYLDYSLHELPLATDDGTNDTNESPSETAGVVLDLIKRYLALYPHERANLSTVLFNCDSSRLPQAIVSKVAELHEDEEDMRCEVILRHRDNKKLSNTYEKIVGSEGEDIDSYIASEATADFMARLRIGIMADQAPAPSDQDGPPTDIVFLQDVIARHAKIEWYAENARFIDEMDLVPARWSRRKASAKDDMKSVVYLISPAQCKEGWAFLTAITTFIKGDWDQDPEKRLLPARQLDFNDTKTASIFKEIHQLGSWVVNYDELLDKRQLLNQKVHVIRYKQTSTQGRNLLISSTASLGLLRSMLISRIKDLNLDLSDKQNGELAEKFIKDANAISGDIVLRAAKRGRNASELMGVVLSKYMIKEELSNELQGWYFLDDYAEWLGQKEEKIADILALCPEKSSDGKFKLSVIVSESKYIDLNSLAPKRKESQKQLRDTVNRINNAIFSSPMRLDKNLWLSRFSDLIMNGIQFPANSSVELSDWRHAIREGDCEVYIRGYSHVFISGPTDCSECSECVQVAELKNGYQEIFSRSKLRELVRAYYNENSAIELRRDSSDVDIWSNIEFKVPGKVKDCSKAGFEGEQQKDSDTNLEENRITIENKVTNKSEISSEDTNTENKNMQIIRGFGPSQEEIEWFKNTKGRCKLALQNFQLRSKLIESESRLTPNCALLKFEGSNQLTVDQVLKRQKEFLTSYGLNVTSVRPEAGLVSISIERPQRQILMLDDVLEVWHPQNTSHCEILIGVKEEDNSILTLSPRLNAPHTLIAGSTGSGKSVLLQNIILSIAVTNKPDEIDIHIIDPKRVSFNKFRPLPHIKGEIIKNMDDSAEFLNSLLIEMDRRYTVLEEHEVEDIYELKRKTDISLPIIWVLHDEFALWMLDTGYRGTVETVVNKLSIAARAAGIFLIFAAQRPDNNVFPMQLRANLGNRLVLRVDGPGTSEISLGEKYLGAEKLLGNGHMIAKLEGESDIIYVQVPFLRPEKLEVIINSLK